MIRIQDTPWENAIDKARMSNLVRTSKQMEFVESAAMMVVERDIEQTYLAKNQQSLKELERGFTITLPMPIVVNNELRVTSNVGQLYIYLLMNLSDERQSLIEDPRAFAEIAMRYDVFFERHWKKMVWPHIARGTSSLTLRRTTRARVTTNT